MDRGSETHAGPVPPDAKTLTTRIAGHARHCGQLLDEIGHDTGISNDSGDADGTIGSRVALDEFEVDHLCGSRDPDLGREAAEGIGSCPNGMPDPDGTARVLGLDEGERPVIVLTFGLSVGAREPQRRSPEEWIVPADRRPFEEVVRRL